MAVHIITGTDYTNCVHQIQNAVGVVFNYDVMFNYQGMYHRNIYTAHINITAVM